MADVTIKYKGANIATMDASGTKTLETSGKYCEGDVQVVYADPEKPTQSKTVTPTASGFTVSPDSGKVLSSVVVNGDADLIASNIRSGKNIFGVDGTLVEGITPSGNKAITATTSTQTGIDVTDYATVSVAPTPSETKSVTTNGDVTPSSGKLLSKVTVNVPTGTARTSADLTVSGATVTVPAGLYSAQATKSVASGSAGTPSASKGTVSNNSVTVTPSVTNTTGYITGGTKTGTGVTVSASELVSGNKALTPSTTAQTNIDVKNYATASVSAITKELLASLDADFVAENVKKDVDLFGLIGALEGGGGGLKFASGTYIPASEITIPRSGADYVYLPYSIDFYPRIGIVYITSMERPPSTSTYYLGAQINFVVTSNLSTNNRAGVMLVNTFTSSANYFGGSGRVSPSFSTGTGKLGRTYFSKTRMALSSDGASSDARLPAGAEYKYFLIGDAE